jgi:hypothetical protein
MLLGFSALGLSVQHDADTLCPLSIRCGDFA